MPASERIGPAYAAMMSMTSHRDRGLPPATRGYCRTICETTVASPKFRFWKWTNLSVWAVYMFEFYGSVEPYSEIAAWRDEHEG